jgi:two-component system chemotaxis response regulator CheY
MMAVWLPNLRILIVEDQLETLQMIRSMLGDLGAQQVKSARDGREALALLDGCDNRFDLVLCDWNMPRMTGLDLLKQVRSVDPGMPFLMITGRAEMGDVMAAKQSGVSAYLRKPFTAEELQHKLSALVRVVAHRRALAVV